MDWVLIALGIGLPLLKFILFPARTMGRGGGWTIVGAMMIVGLMMALWFGIRSLGDAALDLGVGGNATRSTDGNAPSSADIAALAKLL